MRPHPSLQQGEHRKKIIKNMKAPRDVQQNLKVVPGSHANCWIYETEDVQTCCSLFSDHETLTRLITSCYLLILFLAPRDAHPIDSPHVICGSFFL